MAERNEPDVKEADADGFDTRPSSSGLNETIDSDPSELLNFHLLTIGQFALGIIIVIFMGIWMGHYRGGFKWDGSLLEFNWHPLFMTIGFIFFYGNGIIVYRVLRKQPKPMVKLVHFGLHSSALVLAILGLIAAFDFHNHMHYPNLYSLHSWLGLTTVVLFCCQLLFGFTGFLYPRFSQDMREKYLAVHVYFGLAIFMLAIMSSLTGATEKLLFSIKDTYSNFVAEGILANVYGVILVCFGALVVFIATKTSYRRLPDNVEYAVIQ